MGRPGLMARRKAKRAYTYEVRHRQRPHELLGHITLQQMSPTERLSVICREPVTLAYAGLLRGLTEEHFGPPAVELTCVLYHPPSLQLDPGRAYPVLTVQEGDADKLKRCEFFRPAPPRKQPRFTEALR